MREGDATRSKEALIAGKEAVTADIELLPLLAV
jgi:hypothetical protein